MSLKSIHIVFILASSLMTIVFGYWSWREYFSPESSPIHLAYGVSCIIGLAGLLAYGRYFLRKLKHISYL